MTSARERLEEVLRLRPDRETAAIYADLLQDAGDPRGELIAAELARGDAERWKYLCYWFTDELSPPPKLLLTCHHHGQIPWLATAESEFLRHVRIVERLPQAQEMVDAIAQRPRPWLRTMSILSGGDEPCVLTDALAAATPNLEKLEAEGAFDMRELVHPSLRSMRRSIRATQGGASLTWPVYLPALEHLELELDPWPGNVKQAALTLAHMPRLRSLDLSATEPPYGKTRPGFIMFDVFRWLRDAEITAQLERVRLPSVRTASAAADVRAVCDRYPRLEIEIAREYSRCGFGHTLAPRVRVPEPWPWIPHSDIWPDHMSYSAQLRRSESIRLSPTTLGWQLERDYDKMTAEQRAVWRELWAAIDASARSRRPVKVAFALLRRGFEAWSIGDPLESSTQLREQVLGLAARTPDDALVAITRSDK